MGTAYAVPLGGKALLEQDEKQIEALEGKKAELEKAGGDTTQVEGFIAVAKEMVELNNERHALHEATKSFAEAVGIFSKKIEANIEKVNAILATQAEAAIKSAQAVALLQPQTGHNKDDKDDKEED